MWHTPDGVRTLTGPEAILVKASVGFMFDRLRVNEELGEMSVPFDVAPLDRLTLAQQYAILAEVAGALLLPSLGPLELTAIREATVAAIYRTIYFCIEQEIDAERTLPEMQDNCRVWRTIGPRVRFSMGRKPGTG